MADVYVRSGATGTGDGSSFTNAFTTFAAAASGKPAGTRYLLADDHAEAPGSTLTITVQGTATAPDQILCVDHTIVAAPTSADLRATASLATTGAFSVTISGHFYCYGVIFTSNIAGAAGGGLVTLCGAGTNQQRYDSCKFRPLSSAAGANVATSASIALYLNNCSVKFNNVGNGFGIGRGRFVWKRSVALEAGSAIPTFFFLTVTPPAVYSLEGIDFSALTSGKTLFNTATGSVDAAMKDCTVPAGVIYSAAQTGGIGAGDVYVDRCHATNNYNHERHNFAGDQTIEPTITRVGGATDGVQAVSYKVVTAASTNVRWADPFTCLPISIWSDTAGTPVTVTVYGCITGAVALPNKEDIWIDVEYLGTASTPQGNFATSGNADIIASAANVTDGSTWGGGTTTKFKMSVTVTPQARGPITVYVKCAKAGVNAYYIDPKVVLS